MTLHVPSQHDATEQAPRGATHLETPEGGLISGIANKVRGAMRSVTALAAAGLTAFTPMAAHADGYRQPTPAPSPSPDSLPPGLKALLVLEVETSGEKLYGHGGVEVRMPLTQPSATSLPYDPANIDHGTTRVHAGMGGVVSKNLAVGGLAHLQFDPSGAATVGIGPEMFWRLYGNSGTGSARESLILNLGATFYTTSLQPLNLGSFDIGLAARLGLWRLGASLEHSAYSATGIPEFGLGVSVGRDLGNTFSLDGGVQVLNNGRAPVGHAGDVVVGVGLGVNFDLLGK